MKCQHAEIEGSWNSINNGLLEAEHVDDILETCGWTRGGCPRHKETWQRNNNVDNAIKEKRKAWKQWKIRF